MASAAVCGGLSCSSAVVPLVGSCFALLPSQITSGVPSQFLNLVPRHASHLTTTMILARYAGGVMWWFHCLACACLRCLSRIVVVPLPLSKLSFWLPSCHLLASDLDCDVEGAKRSVEAFTFKNRKNIQIQPCYTDALTCLAVTLNRGGHMRTGKTQA